MSGLSTRAVEAAAALLLGVAFCFVVFWWQFDYEPGARGVWQPLVAATPFAGLALLVLGGMRRLATSIAFIVLAALTGLAFAADAESTGSTSGLVWIGPLIYGPVVLVILFVGDTVPRAWRTWRQGWRSSSAPRQR